MSRVVPRLLLSLVFPLTATAHGPVPAGVDVLTTGSAGAPTAVKLSRSAAIELDGTWHFLCRSLWEGPETPLMISANNDTVYLPAINGLYAMDRSGIVTATGNMTLTSAKVRNLLALGDQALALTGFSGGSSIWKLSTEPSLFFESERTIKAAAVDGDELIVSYVDDGDLELIRLDADAKPVGDPRTIAGELTGTLVLVPTSKGLFVRELSSIRYKLYRIDDDGMTQLVDSEKPIHGPVVVDDSVLLAIDRNLARLDGDTPTTLDPETIVTCLHAPTGAEPFACVLPDIRGLTSTGLGTPIFEMEKLTPPVLDHLDSELATRCELDWLDFAVDAALIESPFPEGKSGAELVAEEVVTVVEEDGSEPASGGDGSCQMGHSGTHPGPVGGLAIALLVLGYWNSRRRTLRIRSRLA